MGVDLRLNVSVTLREGTVWADAGHEVVMRQLTLNPDLLAAVKSTVKKSSAPSVSETPAELTVKGKDFMVVWNREDGNLSSLVYSRQPIFEGAHFQAFRAPTDNDKSFGNWLAKDWTKNRIDSPVVKCDRLDYRELGNALEVISLQTYSYLDGSISVESTYTVYGDGTIDLSQSYDRHGNLPELPRLGSVFIAPATLDNVEWLGYGPAENYPDRLEASSIGRWKAKTVDLYTHYPRPQDSGNLESVAQIALFDSKGKGLCVTALTSTFSASAIPYSVEDIYAVSHDCDLTESGHTYLSLDAAVLGLGNSSCGPGVLKKYAIAPGRHILNVRFTPLK